MTRSRSAYRLAWGILIVAAMCGAAPQQAGGPLRKHPTNGRYFTDNSGRAIYLTGSHSWDNFHTFLHTVNPSQILPILQANGHNFIRSWVADTAWSPHTGTFIEPQPYVRTGPGNAADGRLKFNLSQFNQTYFNQLRSFVLDAGNRGIYVSLMLYDAWGISRYHPNAAAAVKEFTYHPYRGLNNINGFNGDPNGDCTGWEYHSLQIPAIVQLQEAYVRKVIDTVNDLDNVLFEICNEDVGTPARD